MLRLLSDAELGDAGSVALNVLLGQVVQKVAALTDHLQQAEAAVIVLVMDLQVLGELIDALGENGDLDLGRARVRLVGAVCLDYGSLFFLRDHGKNILSFLISG